MNLSKNLYVFMLGTLIVFSGCFGTGTTNGEDDDDVGTTVINNYYNNTTVMESMPEYTTITASGPHGDGTYGETIFILQQNAGEAIHLLDWSGVSEFEWDSGSGEHAVQQMIIDTTCWDNTGSEYEGGWSETLNQPSYNAGYAMDQWLAGTGLECSHHFSLQGWYGGVATEYDTDWMSAIYQITPVVVA